MFDRRARLYSMCRSLGLAEVIVDQPLPTANPGQMKTLPLQGIHELQYQLQGQSQDSAWPSVTRFTFSTQGKCTAGEWVELPSSEAKVMYRPVNKTFNAE